MKLKNKIAILISATVFVSAASVAAIYHNALKDAIIRSHYLTEKRNLETIADSLSSAIITNDGVSVAADENTKGLTSRRHYQYSKKKSYPPSMPAATAQKTNPGRSVIFFKDKPYILTNSGGGITKKTDLLYLWRELGLKSLRKSERLYFATDRKGFLVAHEDEERVKARSDFSSLEAVKSALKSKNTSGILITSDEKGVKTAAVWLILPLSTLITDETISLQEKENESLILFSFAPYEVVMSPSKQITARATILILIIALILTALGIMAADKISGPLVRLTYAAKKVGEGHLDFPIITDAKAKGKDEITSGEVGQLYREFSRMTESLKNLLKMRDDLVHMIIHDLKSPLSAIISSVEFLDTNRENPPTEKQKRFLTIARNSSANLMRLIEDMLDAAKLEEGKMKLNISKNADIKSLLNDVAKSFESQKIQEKKILALKLPDGELTADIDESLIRRVVTNIVSNAFRHTRNGEGVIEIEAGITANPDGKSVTDTGCEYLRITISDNGEGIAKENQDKIFDKFVTMSPHHFTNHEGQKIPLITRRGTGLGLTFSKMAVEAHPGGRIFVESEPGRGASFTILLKRQCRQPDHTPI